MPSIENSFNNTTGHIGNYIGGNRTFNFPMITQAIVLDMSYTAKSIIIDIADSWIGTTAMMSRAFDFYMDGSSLGLTRSDFVVYGNHIGTAVEYGIENLFDTSLSLIGAHSMNGWQYNTVAPQRLILVVNSEIEFDEIRLNNHHNSGANTDYGIKNVKIYASPDLITSIIYDEIIENSALIYNGICDQHTSSDIRDDQILDITLGLEYYL